MNKHLCAWAVLTALGSSTVVMAQDAADGIAKYREMLQDGNPAELFEAKGEDLWKQKRGPKAASLEQCACGVLPDAYSDLTDISTGRTHISAERSDISTVRTDISKGRSDISKGRSEVSTERSDV